MKPLRVSANIAPQIADWIATRWGVAVWSGLDLSNPRDIFTPVIARDPADYKLLPTPVERPHWSVGAEPSRIVTDPAEVEVLAWVEHKRFRVGVRRGAQGLSFKVTDGGTRRIRAAVSKLEEEGFEATYAFDYSTQEAIILKCSGAVPLPKFMARTFQEQHG